MCRRISGIAFILLHAAVAFGQVRLNLPDTAATPGSTLVLPITVQGFKNVGSISLTVSFDNKVLVYEGVTNRPRFGYFNATPAAHANSRGAVSLS